MFQFGNVSNNVKPSTLAKTKIVNSLIFNAIKDDDSPYYIFLTDGIPQPTAIWMNFVKNFLKEAKIDSFVIVSAINCSFNKSEIKNGIGDFIINNHSDWKKYLNWNGKHCAGIMTFGPALYGVTKSTDILSTHFYADQFIRPYFYLSHGYCGDYDTFVVPVDGLLELFPMDIKDPSQPINWRTRFFRKQLKVLQDPNKWIPDLTEVNQHIITTREEADKLLNEHMNSNAVAYDTETTGLDTTLDKVYCLTITWNGIDGYYIPWDIINKRLLSVNIDSCKIKITQNGKYDCKIMWANGLPAYTCEPTDDTGQLAHAIHSDRPKGLKPLSYFYTPFGGYDGELDKFKDQTGVVNYSKIPHTILSKYAIMDAISTYRVYFAMVDQVHEIDSKYPNDKMPEWTLWKWYHDIMMPVYPDFIEMEYRGFYIDRDMQLAGQKNLIDKNNELKEIMAKYWNIDAKKFDFGSSVELGKLFEKLGWPCVERGKNGYYSTSDDCLNEYKRIKKPGIDELKAYRTNAVFLQTFMAHDLVEQSGWNKFIRQEPDGQYKIHCNFIVNGTTSFRNIGTEPNLQQIPVHDKNATNVMRMITVPSIEEYKVETDDGRVFKGIATDKVKLTDGSIIEFKDIKEDSNILDYA